MTHYRTNCSKLSKQL